MGILKKYAKFVLCALIITVAIIAPATGLSTGKHGVVMVTNQVDDSGFLPQFDNKFLGDVPESADPLNEREALRRSIWDMSTAAPADQGGPTEASFADQLNSDSGSGYDKLTEMAKNGYADLGSKQVAAATRVVSEPGRGPMNQPDNSWDMGPGAGGSGSHGSSGNQYTYVPPTPPGDGGNGNGDGGNGGNGGKPADNPAVPLPGAVALAGVGLAITGWLRKRRII